MKKFICSAICTSSLLACSGEVQSSNSSLSHAPNQISSARSSSFKWMQISIDDYFNRILRPMYWLKKHAIIPETNAIIAELNSKANYMHSKLLAKYPSQFAHIPTPKVVAFTHPVSSAFSSGLFRCFDVPVVIEGQDQSAEPSADILVVANGKFEVYPEYKRDCVTSNELANNIPEILSQLNKESLNCTFSFINSSVVVNKECSGAELFKNKKLAGFKTIGEVNLISFSTGILKLFNNEEKTLGVLAHELGHYYKAHLTENTKHNGIYFSTNTYNWLTTPTNSADPAIFNLVKQLKNTENISDFYVAKAPYSTATAYIFANILQSIENLESDEVRSVESCSAALGEAGSFFDNLSEIKAKGNNTFRTESFLAYNKNLNICLSNIPVNTADIELNKLINQFVKKVSPYLSKPLVVPSTISNAHNLAVFFESLLPEIRINTNNLVQKTISSGLSMYNSEQEADALALEILNLIGVNPGMFIEALFDLNKPSQGEFKDILQSLDPTSNKCAEFYKNNWLDLETSTKPIKPFIGNLSSEHSEDCYRIYMLSQEITAHGYKMATSLSLLSNWKEQVTKLPDLRLN